MSDNQPYQTPSSSQTSDWRELRRQERAQRRAVRYGGSGGAWVGGVVLILIGVAFMFQNLGWFALENWWALFILIPAAGSFGTAWNVYQNAGYLDAVATRSLISGVFFTILASFFLFGTGWSYLWPAILILGGLGILAGAILPGARQG